MINVEANEKFYADMVHCCTLYNARRAARVVTEMYETILAPSGVHAAQFPLLVAVKVLGSAPVSVLAHGLQTDRTTLTRTLKPLQESGWVTITEGKDRRVREVALTSSGAAALADATPLWEQAQKQAQQQLGSEQWRSLLHHLQQAATLKAV